MSYAGKDVLLAAAVDLCVPGRPFFFFFFKSSHLAHSKLTISIRWLKCIINVC